MRRILLLTLLMSAAANALAAGTMTRIGSLAVQRHTATLLRDGRVLIAGGSELVVVFDPAVDGVTETLFLDRPYRGMDAVMVEDGSVLLMGGVDTSAYEFHADVLRYRPTPIRSRRRAVR